MSLLIKKYKYIILKKKKRKKKEKEKENGGCRLAPCPSHSFEVAKEFDGWAIFLHPPWLLPPLAPPFLCPSGVSRSHSLNWTSSPLPIVLHPLGATQPRHPRWIIPHLKQNLGIFSYLKEIQITLSLMCRILPLDIGFVKSSTIRTRIKAKQRDYQSRMKNRNISSQT